MAYDNLMPFQAMFRQYVYCISLGIFCAPDRCPLSPAPLHIFKTCISRTPPPLRRDFFSGEWALLLVFTSKLFGQNRAIWPPRANKAALSLPLLPPCSSVRKNNFGDDDGASPKSEQDRQEGGKSIERECSRTQAGGARGGRQSERVTNIIDDAALGRGPQRDYSSSAAGQRPSEACPASSFSQRADHFCFKKGKKSEAQQPQTPSQIHRERQDRRGLHCPEPLMMALCVQY